MNLIKILALVIMLILITTIFSYEKINECEEKVTKGIVLSFDDKKNIFSWNESREFLQEKNIIATFYVDHWDKLTSEEINILKALDSDGHEIGVHTMNHSSYFRHLENNGTPQAYLTNEVLPSKEFAQSLGFEISSFAYPFGHRDSIIDSLILEHFVNVRGTYSYPDETQSWHTSCKDGNVFRSISPTSSEGIHMGKIIETISNLEDDKTLFVNGHGINNGGYPITLENLTLIADLVNNNNIKWLKMKEI